MRVRERELPSIVNIIARNTRRIMKEKQITCNKLAALIKRPVMTVNDFIHGRSNPGADLLFAVADALDVRVDDLRERRASKKSA